MRNLLLIMMAVVLIGCVPPQGGGSGGGGEMLNILLFMGLFFFVIPGLVYWFSVQNRREKQRLNEEMYAARDKYAEALEELSRDNSSEKKIRALEAGRSYAAVSRLVAHGDKAVTVFDEVALTNDINARMND